MERVGDGRVVGMGCDYLLLVGELVKVFVVGGRVGCVGWRYWLL